MNTIEQIRVNDLLKANRTQTSTISRRYENWFNDLAVRKYLFPTTPSLVSDIEVWLRSIADDERYEYWFLVEPITGIHIGHVGLSNIDFQNRIAEIGIVIGNKEYWNRGLGTYAVNWLIEYAFRERKLTKLRALIHKDNATSIKIFTKIGFVKSGKAVELMPEFSEFILHIE